MKRRDAECWLEAIDVDSRQEIRERSIELDSIAGGSAIAIGRNVRYELSFCRIVYLHGRAGRRGQEPHARAVPSRDVLLGCNLEAFNAGMRGSESLRVVQNGRVQGG